VEDKCLSLHQREATKSELRATAVNSETAIKDFLIRHNLLLEMYHPLHRTCTGIGA